MTYERIQYAHSTCIVSEKEGLYYIIDGYRYQNKQANRKSKNILCCLQYLTLKQIAQLNSRGENGALMTSGATLNLELLIVEKVREMNKHK
jgi:hypothetical protein